MVVTGTLKHKKHNQRKVDRAFLLNISLFLLGQEELRKQFWNVKKVAFNRTKNTVRIGINTTNGKLGTTLSKLRKTSKGLSDHLYHQSLTPKQAIIEFYVDKEDEELERLHYLLDHVI